MYNTCEKWALHIHTDRRGEESKTSICQLKLWVKIKLQEAVVDRYKTLKYYQVHSRHSDRYMPLSQQKYFYFCFPTLPVNLTLFILISFHYILKFCNGLQKYQFPPPHESHTVFTFYKIFFHIFSQSIFTYYISKSTIFNLFQYSINSNLAYTSCITCIKIPALRCSGSWSICCTVKEANSWCLILRHEEAQSSCRLRPVDLSCHKFMLFGLQSK